MKNEKGKITPPTGNETADMSVYMSALMERYKPALFGEQATHWFSTDEVLLALRELNPSANIKQGDVYQAMWNLHFNNSESHCLGKSWTLFFEFCNLLSNFVKNKKPWNFRFIYF